ncbi:MAG: inorganic phosphate transporter [Flavobacteriales bacterium]|nr:inorganic phosphate transporter [Flavobacteriales bacterium]
MATVVSTKVLTPLQAVLWAGFFNFVAFFIFKDHAVANTISKTVHAEFITLPVILSGLIAAIIWNLLTWWYGIPSSSSQHAIGGFAGAAIAHAFATTDGFSLGEVVENDKITKTLLFIFLAPLVGMVISMFITFVTIVRKVWTRIGIIVIASVATWFLFTHFPARRFEENLQKFDRPMCSRRKPRRTRRGWRTTRPHKRGGCRHALLGENTILKVAKGPLRTRR